MLGSARGRWCNPTSLLTRVLRSQIFVPQQQFLIDGAGDVGQHASPVHSRASLKLIVEPGLYMLLRFQKAAGRGNYETGNQAFSKCLRFLTIRARTPESRDVRAVGPYVESIATFLPYPGSRVQVIAARFHEAKYCEGDQVRCERWFDPQEGGAAFILDVLVANGQLIRKWSEEKKQYAYRTVSYTH